MIRRANCHSTETHCAARSRDRRVATLLVGWLLLVPGMQALAQVSGTPPGGLPRIPQVDEASALSGKALLEELRRGGYVLYLRHTETGEVTPTCDKSNLTASGREEARRIGQEMRRLEIPFDKVISSEVCRVWETARLVDVAPVETHEDLHRNPKREDHRLHEGRARLIATVPPPGKNRLLVGHMQNGNGGTDRLFMDMGEVIVFRPKADGPPVPVARIRSGEWGALSNGAPAQSRN